MSQHQLWFRLKRSIDAFMQVIGHKPPPPSFALAFDAGIPSSTMSTSSMIYGSVQEMIKDISIVFGVPKYRTSKPKKVTRKFAVNRLLKPVDNLVSCPACANIHPSDTICDKCYEKVRLLTNEIKKKMMEYNPYVGERQDKPVHVRFRGDPEEKPQVVNGKRVIELEKERPSWFRKMLLLKK
ncbi:unnamed protein product [Caenorhabditis bovis]|uniref:Large ribosomal subunit protein bL32m n=1 Tax=Caenorhabditis bovis TaxID=2654633 RepID=A0A8S1EED1_9PELO|nr:unnamed protein product [Caenorhabditis bovis]